MPISLDSIRARRAVLEDIDRPALKKAENVVLDAAGLALHHFLGHEKIYLYARQDGRLDIVPPQYKIESGVGVTFLNPKGQVLLEKTRNGAYGVFRREIEEQDFANPKTPVTLAALHRGGQNSSLKVPSLILGRAILNRSTLVMPNKDLERREGNFWTEPVYLVQLSKCSDEVAEAVNAVAQKALGLAWADLSDILDQQEQMDADYQKGIKELSSENQMLKRAKINERLFDIRHRPIVVSGTIQGDNTEIRVEDPQRTFATSKQALRTLLGGAQEERKG